MAAAAAFRSQERNEVKKHVEEEESFEDNTAFGDTIDVGAEIEAQLAAQFEARQFGELDDKVVNFHMDDQYLKRKWRRENFRTVTKWFAKTLGLLVASIGFCLLGGYMFSSMELFNEVETCKNSREKYYRGRDSAKEAILSAANNFQISQSDRLSQYTLTLDTFISAYHNSTWNGAECETMLPEWNFVSATFFCATVVTSIGYGWIAPVTFWGRCVLIAYAVIGIPMFLAAMANIGAFFSEITHYAYHNVCCCGACRESTMDVDAKKQMRHQMIALWRTEPNAPTAHFLEAIEDDSGGDSSENEAADEMVSGEPVPVSASCLILVSVFIFGGSIFSFTEKWPFEDGVYFAFITTATIGFGDLVPGLVGTNTERQQGYKFGLTWFFMIFGIAVLSTCLQMIQESLEESVKKMMKFFNSNKKQNPNFQDLGPNKKVDSDSETPSEVEVAEPEKHISWGDQGPMQDMALYGDFDNNNYHHEAPNLDKGPAFEIPDQPKVAEERKVMVQPVNKNRVPSAQKMPRKLLRPPMSALSQGGERGLMLAPEPAMYQPPPSSATSSRMNSAVVYPNQGSAYRESPPSSALSRRLDSAMMLFRQTGSAVSYKEREQSSTYPRYVDN